MSSGVPDHITVENKGTTTVKVDGLDDIGLDATLHTPDTLKSDSTLTSTMSLAVTERGPKVFKTTAQRWSFDKRVLSIIGKS